MSRPELTAPPDVYYNETEAAKYDKNSRIQLIQRQIALRALELLALPPGKTALLLDVGCGSGLSGAVLEEAGHVWVGCDISRDMLGIAAERESDAGDVFQRDMGQGMPFRPGTFDGAISISALQWLCYSDKKAHTPKARLMRFFTTLYASLKRTARAALQFYPQTPEQAVLIAQCAQKAGFAGGLVVDFPNSTKAKKYYLVLMAGAPCMEVPLGEGAAGEAMGADDVYQQGYGQAGMGGKGLSLGKRARQLQKGRRNEPEVKGKAWVNKNKEKRRARGLEVKRDSKYTARKRKARF